MSRFIIRAVRGDVHEVIRQRLRDAASVSVLDETPRMVLVEADSESHLRAAVDLADMLVVPERHFEPPETIPKIR